MRRFAAFAALVCLAAASAAQAQDEHRFALSMFHFNIQYVAGGTAGYLPFSVPGWSQTMEENEDQIVVESFEPVLDVYLAHPGWGVNLEMQAYMLEVIAERHPDVLEKVRTLVDRGQAEMVSFHYSDQFFLAYPYLDWKRSVDRTKELYADLGIALGTAVFCQEGQSGIGMADRMAEEGYGVMVWPKNLIRYNIGGEFDAAPLYRFGDVVMVAGSQGVDYDDGETRIQSTWTFFDDGELLATNDMNPYFPPLFVHDRAATDEYEAKLADLEEQGYDIATVSQYVEAVEGLGIEPVDPPPMLDGTWQPQSHTMWRWLGDASLFGRQERDGHVRTLCATAHRELVAAETMLADADEQGADVADLGSAVDEAWRLLNLGEVTDATGINPFQGEIGYGLAHCGEALRVAHDVIADAAARTGADGVTIDTRAGTVEDAADADPGEPVAALFDLAITARGREVTQLWTQTAAEPATYRVELRFTPSEIDAPAIRVTFPGTTTEITYCPALRDERPITYDRSDFGWENYPMALANGMIGLGGGRWVIKDQGYTHIAAFLLPDDLDVSFQEETLSATEEVTWVFWIVEGTVDEAVEVANRVNVWPTVTRTFGEDEQ